VLLDPFILARTVHFASVATLAGLMFFLLLVFEPVVRRVSAAPDEAATALHVALRACRARAITSTNGTRPPIQAPAATRCSASPAS